MLHRLFFLCFFITVPSVAQVGIGTTNPQNTLHVEGGLRITNIPSGVDQDAEQRVLATDENGDVVQVSRDQFLNNVNFPEVVFSAKYGTTNPLIPFFTGCNPCSGGQLLRLNLVQPNIAYQKVSAIEVNDPSGTNGDESFRIKEDGYYTFEIQTSLTLNKNNIYYVNFYMSNTKFNGTVETDILRIYAGSPAFNSGNGQIGTHITFKDVKFYNAGDEVIFAFQPAFNSDYILNGKPTGASYAAQLTVTKFTN